ncbi:hypothetical protein GCM10008955_33220 [Deinococcus malanensis]|uniref:Uncharacterized protein n=1 Tax=Deinococcus malanensis TaxID=1706855 RepID=A0ABQ2F0T7_9DEIO|nr:hypothetical protein GCM10008955_33220 [Deinococcus malanensis]
MVAVRLLDPVATLAVATPSSFTLITSGAEEVNVTRPKQVRLVAQSGHPVRKLEREAAAESRETAKE